MEKDRDIPITEYLDVLQKEFLVAEIRHKIYSKINDKQFWEKVMKGKKRKIEDICFRNKIDNIFTSDEEKRRMYSVVYNEHGLPNFNYKDDVQRFGNGEYPGLEQTDIENYYSFDSEVRVDVNGKRVFGKITGYTENRELILVESESIEVQYERELVTRIL
jgi:hypothetical protein